MVRSIIILLVLLLRIRLACPSSSISMLMSPFRTLKLKYFYCYVTKR